MKIYTSYFAKQKELEKHNIVCIGICAIIPKWFNGVNLESVAPSKSILFEHKENPDDERYIQRYKKEILCAYQTAEQCQYLIDRIAYISGGKDVALCCYEKPGEFCHRHILADYLNSFLNLGIEEYKFEDTIQSDSVILF